MLSFGFPIALSYLVAGEGRDTNSLIDATLAIVAFATGAGVVIGLPVAVIGWGGHPAALAGAAITSASVSNLAINRFVIGQERFVEYARLSLAPWVLTTAGVTALVVTGTNSVLATGVSLLVGQIVTLLLGLRIVQDHDRRRRFRWRSAGNGLRSAWPHALPSFITDATSTLRSRGDIYLVTAVVGTIGAARYGAAASAGSFISLLSQATSLVVMPVTAREASKAERLTAHRAARLAFAASAVVAGGLALLAPLALRIAFGDGYEAAAATLRLYLPGVVALALSRSLTAMLNGLGHFDVTMRISVWITVLALIAIGVGSHFAGIEGAAAGASLAATVNTLWRLDEVRRRSGIRALDLLVPRRGDVSWLMSTRR